MIGNGGRGSSASTSMMYPVSPTSIRAPRLAAKTPRYPAPPFAPGTSTTSPCSAFPGSRSVRSRQRDSGISRVYSIAMASSISRSRSAGISGRNRDAAMTLSATGSPGLASGPGSELSSSTRRIGFGDSPSGAPSLATQRRSSSA